jgi:regulator of cell morphogenesis and NO signaling
MHATTTLADLATTTPGASRVFHRLGLDYCCGGRRPLQSACDERGLDSADVLAAIRAEGATTGDLTQWSDAPLADLIAHIVATYHARLREELPLLVAMAAKVEQVHAGRPGCPWGLAARLALVQADVLDHLAKEEQILFPLLQSGAGPRVAQIVRVMEAEHQDHGTNLATLRELTGDHVPPDHACATWRALYVRLAAFEAELMDHIHLENNVLFPRAVRATV